MSEEAKQAIDAFRSMFENQRWDNIWMTRLVAIERELSRRPVPEAAPKPCGKCNDTGLVISGTYGTNCSKCATRIEAAPGGLSENQVRDLCSQFERAMKKAGLPVNTMKQILAMLDLSTITCLLTPAPNREAELKVIEAALMAFYRKYENYGGWHESSIYGKGGSAWHLSLQEAQEIERLTDAVDASLAQSEMKGE